MNRAIISLQLLVFCFFVICFSITPSRQIYYLNADDHWQPVDLKVNSAISDRNIALWSERELSRMLNMPPPIEQQTEPAFRQLMASFMDHHTASQFFIELNKVDFFEHLVEQKQHSIFAPTQATVVVSKWNQEFWIVQTKGLLTFRSTKGESTIKLIFQMNIKIDKRSGKKRFASGRLKRVA
ncbi:MAG: hypothetical protein Q9M92_04165 [Enterobacterales bacterium]|nr:hypothetical protein [Enterobacterales bacterium]